jgi:DNA (cytosine-5)-methyltransferase 1
LRLLDLFCGAGGCAVGYHRAGFTDIVGVDIKPQPRYPFAFVQGDALEYLAAHGHEFDAIHASPPCQRYSQCQNFRDTRDTHPDLVFDCRTLLEATGRPWVIENVPGSPLENAAVLCGLMFGLRVIRHRLFEASFLLLTPPHTRHPAHLRTGTASKQHRGVRTGYSDGKMGLVSVAGNNFNVKAGAAAMGIDWMTRDELAQAIPPAYTEFVGRQLLDAVGC